MVATLLGIPSIYTNDNEHALGNKPAFFYATKILIPENLPVERVAKTGIPAKKVMQYPGVKEGIYLWAKGEAIQEKRKQISTTEVNIYIRPEPQTAQYYKGKENFLDDTIIALQEKYFITILPRDANQSKHYKQQKFKSINVPDKPMSFDIIAANCSIFIGAGGSMTRELAILGVPTISVYQDDLLEVDQFLIERKLMLHEPSLTPEKVEGFINSLQNKPPALELMNKGKAAYQLFKQEILKFEKR